jgi:hypothetical protein
MLYHVNPETGATGKCSATKGGCPFGSTDEHFTSAEAARAAFESSQKTFSGVSKSADLSTILPDWHDKLPSHIETKIAKKLRDDFEFVRAVEAGEIETKYAYTENFLTPPVFATRDRGAYFTDSIDEYDDNPLEDEYYIAIHSRQGGGNRECYCYDVEEDGHESGCSAASNDELEDHPQFVTYRDNDFDSTYTTHYFKAGSTKEDREKHEAQQKLVGRFNNAKAHKQAIESGEVPPWSILTNETEPIGVYRSAKKAAANRTTALDRDKAAATSIKAGIEAIKNADELTEAEVATLSQHAADFSNRYLFRSLASDLKTLRTKKAEVAATESMTTEAEALPDGDLKDYLLGDRGTGTYNTTVKQGRRNVTVAKTYQKGTRLGKELEERKRDLGYAENAVKRPLEKLEEKYKTLSTQITTQQAQLDELETQRVKAWRVGWPGTVRDMPAIPKEF